MAQNITIISADSHAGASMEVYRGYLESSWHDEFDAWRQKYKNPYQDLREDDDKIRNWDTARRNADQYADGIVGEVVFPNTVPPFFPTAQLIAYPPSREESYQRRLAGIRAHNRWLAEWCAEDGQHRAGMANVFLNNVDDAVADATAAADAGLPGILLPNIPPDLGIPPISSRTYDPLWKVCEERGLVVNSHGGSGLPKMEREMFTPFLMLMEVPFFSNRVLWHLIMSGVFERFPGLKFVQTEQGVAWAAEALGRMDRYWKQVKDSGKVGELEFDVGDIMPLSPSEYFARNCWIGASFPSPSEAAAIRELPDGVNRVMWGADYPHNEGCFPHSREALRRSFAGWNEADMARILTTNAAELFGFDLPAMAYLGVAHGPTHAEITAPLDTIPDNPSPAFHKA